MGSADLLGRTIADKYRLLRLLGEGGMGAVYEAENLLTFKRVAIKVMHPELATGGDATARMLREAQTASRIRHPHVVDVYDAGYDGDRVFIVMQYLEGESLAEAARRGGMPLHEAISLLSDAMRGVAAAHRAGVIHRDIKPENIFLARECDQVRPVVKVLDFGVSKLTDGGTPRLTRTDVTVGTPVYMSYEQLSGRREGAPARVPEPARLVDDGKAPPTSADETETSGGADDDAARPENARDDPSHRSRGRVHRAGTPRASEF